MKKLNRTFEVARKIVFRRIYRYVLARNLLFAVQYDFDLDDIEMALEDSDDAILYFEQQDYLRKCFSIHSKTLKRFSMIRYEGGNYVDYLPLMKQLERSVLRDKRSNSAIEFNPETQKRRSYGVGRYSMMYIFNEQMMKMICDKFNGSKEYDPKLDLGSHYFADIIRQLKSDFPDMKFLDMNKPQFRLFRNSNLH